MDGDANRTRYRSGRGIARCGHRSRRKSARTLIEWIENEFECMMPIFTDDAPLDARREAAYQRLMAICPTPLRLIVEPMVKVAVSKASEAEIASLMIDVESLPRLAESGDSDGIIALARRYGASDEMVGMYLPLFESAKGNA